MANKKKEVKVEEVVEESVESEEVLTEAAEEVAAPALKEDTQGPGRRGTITVDSSGVSITKETAVELIDMLQRSFSTSNNVPFRLDLKRLIGALSEAIVKAE